MSQRPENPSAFPHLDWFATDNGPIAITDEKNPGMTLRDHFAGLAMASMVTTAAAPCLLGLDGAELNTARAAYKLADAMLKAREEQP